MTREDLMRRQMTNELLATPTGARFYDLHLRPRQQTAARPILGLPLGTPRTARAAG